MDFKLYNNTTPNLENSILLQQKAYPYAPKIYNYFYIIDDNQKYLVVISEHIEHNLDDWIKGKNDEDIRLMINKIFKGYNHLNKNNITHGQMTWENILLKDNNDIVFKNFEKSYGNFSNPRIRFI